MPYYYFRHKKHCTHMNLFAKDAFTAGRLLSEVVSDFDSWEFVQEDER